MGADMYHLGSAHTHASPACPTNLCALERNRLYLSLAVAIGHLVMSQGALGDGVPPLGGQLCLETAL